ncbi:outer membrane lipoprotein carrier protein LolA, partial [Staphylococcus hominis]
MRFLRTLGVLALLAVASPVLAAPAASVDLVKQRVAKVNVLRGEFSQDKQVSGFKNPLRSQGRFVLAQDRGVIWTTLKPF